MTLDPIANSLRIRVHGMWEKIVLRHDHDYFRSLLADFKKRAAHDPDALFRQLCSLNVGLFVTYKSGPDLTEDSESIGLYSEFVSL